KQFDEAQGPRPRASQSRQGGRNCGALLDKRFDVLKPQHEGQREMPYSFMPKAECLVGHPDIVVRRYVDGVECKRLAQHFHGLIVAASLLRHVAKKDKRAHMFGVAREYFAAQFLSQCKLAVSVMGN